MAIMKTCKHCGIVPMNHKCNKARQHKERLRSNKEDRLIYKTNRWQGTRSEVLEEYKNICLWSYFIDGRIILANTVHHITPILDDDTKAFEHDNLIPLNEVMHGLVHRLYDTGYKKECIDILYKLKEMELNVKSLGSYDIKNVLPFYVSPHI